VFQTDGAPDRFRHDDGQQIGRERRSGELRNPVRESIECADFFRDPETDCYRWIEVAAGNMANCGDHDADGQAVRGGDRQQADA